MKPCETLIISYESGYNIQAGGSVPVAHAWRMIARDHEQVFGKKPLQTEDEASIMIRYAEEEEDAHYGAGCRDVFARFSGETGQLPKASRVV
ncbi:hypothetical protein QOZ95_003689 [Paenibacillus brasilensis]|uniref:Uncharacterized protein n=1 Tax=Paenibacillus brasilensis TaxID=128574 RepID=A0ABU0L1U1_9BACL|nr:hypothetical protein [Paenibacillus brasilensis]